MEKKKGQSLTYGIVNWWDSWWVFLIRIESTNSKLSFIRSLKLIHPRKISICSRLPKKPQIYPILECLSFYNVTWQLLPWKVSFSTFLNQGRNYELICPTECGRSNISSENSEVHQLKNINGFQKDLTIFLSGRS